MQVRSCRGIFFCFCASDGKWEPQTRQKSDVRLQGGPIYSDEGLSDVLNASLKSREKGQLRIVREGIGWSLAPHLRWSGPFRVLWSASLEIRGVGRRRAVKKNPLPQDFGASRKEEPAADAEGAR